MHTVIIVSLLHFSFPLLISSLPVNSSFPSIPTSTVPPSTTQFNLSRLIRVKKGDWRDEQEKNDIIWSHESRHHPDFGKETARVGGDDDRIRRSSQIMSFVILGTVVAFILYTYLSHVTIMRRLRREKEEKRIFSLVQSSALLVASHSRAFGPRRNSILNMFRGFRL